MNMHEIIGLVVFAAISYEVGTMLGRMTVRASRRGNRFCRWLLGK